MARTKSTIFLGLLLACCVYSYWLANKDFEWIVPSMSDRAPAAVRNSEDLQKVLEKPLRVFKKEAVISTISITRKDNKQVFRMGQFAVHEGAKSNLICIEYPYMRLKFVGEGAAVNGNKPVFWLRMPCQIQQQKRDFLSEVPLPFNELNRWPAQNQEMEISDSSGMPVRGQTEYINQAWPNVWYLDQVEFFHDANEQGEKIEFTNKDLIKEFGSPVFVR